MSQTIDELQIRISSDASSAITQLDRLAAAMGRVGSNSSAISSSAAAITSLSQSLERFGNVDFKDAVSGLKELQPIIKSLKGKNVDIKFNVTGQDKIAYLKDVTLPDLAKINLKDTGINTTVNAIQRLTKLDTSKFSAATQSVADSLEKISQVGGTSNNLNQFIAAIARLANAGDKTNQTAQGLIILTPVLKDAMVAFQGVGEISGSITAFVTALSKLASSGNKASVTSQQLKDLAQAVLDFLTTLQNAPEVNSNIAMTIQGLGNLAAAGQRVGNVLNTSGVFSNKSSALGNNIAVGLRAATSEIKNLLKFSISLGAKGASAVANFASKLGLIPRFSSGIDRTAISFGNLLRAVLPFVGIRGVFDWLKDSVEAGSSIVELQNVIDTAFGDLGKNYENISGYIYNWSKGTIDAFGVSEIAAQRYAGRLMSMFNSSGFDVTEGMRDSAAKMSTELIERAGDIASFYDMSVDEAMTKMQAALAGMTRPMRALGVNMNVANLEAFALSQGINQSWQSMDQATQMMVRYEYMLHATQYAQGDFARTSGKIVAPCYRKVA